MPRAAGPFSLFRKWPGWINVRHKTGGIYLLDCGNKNHIYARILEQTQVARQVTGISTQVFAWPKLCRVDENARDQHIVLAARLVYEREMSFMEVSHGRHQPDIKRTRPSLVCIYHLMNGANYAHPLFNPFTALIPKNYLKTNIASAWTTKARFSIVVNTSQSIPSG